MKQVIMKLNGRRYGMLLSFGTAVVQGFSRSEDCFLTEGQHLTGDTPIPMMWFVQHSVYLTLDSA